MNKQNYCSSYYDKFTEHFLVPPTSTSHNKQLFLQSPDATTIIYLHRQRYVTETESVYCAVRTQKL
jgi:hypothetical protein